MEKFNKEISYKAVISFDVDLSYKTNLDDLRNRLLVNLNKKIKDSDIIYEAMSIQLDTFREVLKENGIESYSTNIQGMI